MKEPEFRKAPGDGADIQLAQWPGKGETVFCIHGLTANCRCWDKIASVISPEHQVLAMDLRGRGFSDKPETGYSVDQHCRDIESVLRHLELDRVVLMGHSLGAFIAAYFAATRPEMAEKAILVDGAGQLSSEQMNKVFEGIKLSLERLGKVFPDYENYVETLKKAPFFQSWSEYLDVYFQYETQEANGGVRSRVYAGGIQEEITNLANIEIGDYYGRISCPVLILRATEGMMGPDDILLPQDAAERMEKEIPSARRVDIAGSNHYSLIFEDFESRDRAIREFLSS
ncbi:MAG: alpha/beta hydrolase [Desulfobacterales bacterium]|nr:alpha/beta hydrolase [Desulfobacterales bacterium]